MPAIHMPTARAACRNRFWLPLLFFCLAAFRPVAPAQSSGSAEPDASGQSAKPTKGTPASSIDVQAPMISLDAMVLTREGEFIPGLQKEQFRLWEDNVEQPIQSFGLTKAGYTAVLLVEFASTPAFQASRRQFLYDALRASYAFTGQMQKDDYVSVISYDAKPSVLVDFTSDKQAIYSALDGLRMPGDSDTNLYRRAL